MVNENFEITKDFGIDFTERVIDLIGIKALKVILQDNFSGGEISIDKNGKIEIHKDKIKNNVGRLVFIFSGKLSESFGPDLIEDLFQDIYKKLSKKYRKDVSVIIDLIPAQFLEQERVKYLSKEELEQRVLDRTKELRELNVSLEKQVKRRTKELQEKVEQLEGFQKFAVGREQKMIELKGEIERLKEDSEKK
ncbi:MAG: hypothetical protein KJI71_04910 [Patescibacteria group bacterium]|nr:hypothetical protein [Patescibacteria group bacterium]